MTPNASQLSLHAGLIASGMDYHQLWLRQIAVGGDASELELEAYVIGLLDPDTHHHNVIAQAINEHFIELGGNHPVAYWDHGTHGSVD